MGMGGKREAGGKKCIELLGEVSRCQEREREALVTPSSFPRSFPISLQAGSLIVENLRTYRRPIFVYLPKNAELR